MKVCTVNSDFKKVFCFFFKIFCWTHVHFWGHCFRLLVTSPLGFKARGFCLILTLQRHMWYTFPEIHLWCNTSASICGQHSSQLLSQHVCFSRGRMPDLNHRPPAWQADALTTRPQRPGFSQESLLCVQILPTCSLVFALWIVSVQIAIGLQWHLVYLW